MDEMDRIYFEMILGDFYELIPSLKEKVMKKSHLELSNVVCSIKGCGKRLKQRVVDLKPTASLCYEHFKEEERRKGRLVRSGSEVRKGLVRKRIPKPRKEE